MLQQYDVVVIGAGISGLLITYGLSKEFSICLIDSNSTLTSNKYWLTDDECITDLPELYECIDNTLESMNFTTFDSFVYKLYGKYLLWDENRLISYLRDISIEHGVDYKCSTTFYSYSYKDNGVIVNTSAGDTKCRLLIDCTGVNSTIGLSHGLIKIIGYYYAYGRLLKTKTKIQPVALENVILSNKPRYFEVFPKKNDYAYSALLAPQKYLSHSSDLKKEFEFIITKSHYSEYFELDNSQPEIKGIVPVGLAKKNSLDNILLYGEAAAMNPAATASCLTVLLRNYTATLDNIKRALHTNKLSSQALSKCCTGMNRFNRNFQLNLYNEILDWHSAKYSNVVKTLDYVGNEFMNKLVFANIDKQSILNRNMLINIYRYNLWYLLRPLLRSIIIGKIGL